MEKNGQIEEAMLYCLYMMSDGEISYSEEKLFNKICAELELSTDDKIQALTSCNKIADDIKSVKDFVEGDRFGELIEWKIDTGNATNTARIIWNLVNLGYADKQYSEEEQHIVSFLVDRWHVNKEVLREMIDTAETILSLEGQKEWLMKTFSSSERDKREKTIDVAIKKLFEDMKITIDELTM